MNQVFVCIILCTACIRDPHWYVILDLKTRIDSILDPDHETFEYVDMRK